MADHVYRIVQIAGSSQVSLSDAIQTAINRAAKTTRHLRWFEVVEQRGEIDNGQVKHYQVVLKVGFQMEDV